MGQPRPLGRGLEQLSRAFLTQESPASDAEPPGAPAESPAPAPREPRAAPTAERPPRDTVPAPLALLTPATVTRTRILAALRELPDGLEEGLRILDEALPCPPCGAMDLLAVDRANRLAVVDLETVAGDELLVRGLGHIDWMIGNVPGLRRMYRGNPINFSLHPKLFLLAPQYSARLRYAARQIATPEIECLRYHAVEAPGGPGIFLERLPAFTE